MIAKLWRQYKCPVVGKKINNKRNSYTKEDYTTLKPAYIYVCVCVCVCIYIHTHTHTHTYIYGNIKIKMAFCRKIYMVWSHLGKKKNAHSFPHHLSWVEASCKFRLAQDKLHWVESPAPSFQPNGSVPQDGHTWGRKDRWGPRVRTPTQRSKMEAASILRQTDLGSNQAFISYQLSDLGQSSSPLWASISPSIKGD